MGDKSHTTMYRSLSFLQFREKVREGVPFPSEVPSKEWMVRIKTILGILKKKSTDMCIFEVPNELRKVKEDAYSPQIVSIGPLHEGKPNLLAMEEHKWRYMLFLLQRTPDEEKFLDKCGEAILDVEPKARGSYEKNIEFDTYELAEILLVDGCFILELFLRSDPDFKDDSDLIFLNALMVPALRYDLTLLENQIPFFVLECLLKIFVPFLPKRLGFAEVELRDLSAERLLITNLALSFFHPRLKLRQEKTNVGHLLDVRHLLDLLHNFYRPTSRTDPKNKETSRLKNCATNLLEAGIEFKKGNEDHLIDISFSKGVITIPPLHINETTDSLLRNLIAYEQCSIISRTHHITSYVLLMKSLIQSKVDIKLLQRREIIPSNLGGVEDGPLTLFNDLSRKVVVKEFFFDGFCEEVNAYKNSWWHWHRHKSFWKVRWQRYITALKQDYFSNPWRIIGFIVAVVLLILTGLQTFYTVRSYYPR